MNTVVLPHLLSVADKSLGSIHAAVLAVLDEVPVHKVFTNSVVSVVPGGQANAPIRKSLFQAHSRELHQDIRGRHTNQEFDLCHLYYHVVSRGWTMSALGLEFPSQANGVLTEASQEAECEDRSFPELCGSSSSLSGVRVAVSLGNPA